MKSYARGTFHRLLAGLSRLWGRGHCHSSIRSCSTVMGLSRESCCDIGRAYPNDIPQRTSADFYMKKPRTIVLIKHFIMKAFTAQLIQDQSSMLWLLNSVRISWPDEHLWNYFIEWVEISLIVMPYDLIHNYGGCGAQVLDTPYCHMIQWYKTNGSIITTLRDILWLSVDYENECKKCSHFANYQCENLPFN